MTLADTDHWPSRSFDVQVAARAIIEQAITDHPRSAQAEIGASEIGTPCVRKLAFKLSSQPRLRPEQPAWRPTVGTAVHSWLEAAFKAENARLAWERWLTEMPLSIGELAPERTLRGHCDLYDRLTSTVVDFKVPGITTIKKAKANKSPGDTYRTQAHCYGLGWRNAGFAVKTVAILYLPAAGELADQYYWSEPYDESIARAALARARGLITAGTAVGWDNLIPRLPLADDHCVYCPWWQPGNLVANASRACPGALPMNAINDTGPAFGAVKR